MRLVGYADKLTVEPSGDVNFMVSSEPPRYRASLVQLIHGDDSPGGPGFKYGDVESEITGEYAGQVQGLRPGSYVRIPSTGVPDPAGSLTIQMWIRSTMPRKATQTLMSSRSADGGGYALRLANGHLSLQVGGGPGSTVGLTRPVERNTWYLITAIYDAHSCEARLLLEPREGSFAERLDSERRPLQGGRATSSADLIIAGEMLVENGKDVVGNFYNGKIDAPRVFDRALADGELGVCGHPDAAQSHGLVAWWDFSIDISSRAVSDVSANGLGGRTVNKPMRGATGWNWDGSETAWPHAPSQYGAIHFHDDDLDDAGWAPSLGWMVPDDMPSGVYAVHLRADTDEDFIPFIVRPKQGRPTARIACLMPTFTYLAYANEHLLTSASEAMAVMGARGDAAASYPSQPQDKYIVANRLNSLYDVHTDGSGVCYSSRLRPLLTMRPRYKTPQLNKGEGTPHLLNADLHLIDWLYESGYAVDVLTDEDLHLEGADLLDPYAVVLTGTHHEYWSLEMISGTQQYLQDGGRLMYLGGNGMYWVTQHDPESRAGIEIRRRGPSTRVWEPEPGEAHLSATGELGGLWRYRGYYPQGWLGVGFTAQGLDEGRPYDRRADSFDRHAAWVFDGIGKDEQIGDFPSLVNGYGAAGFEIDRIDYELGTPQRTLLLATASKFSEAYQHVSEEVLVSDSRQGGHVSPMVRADMVLLEYPHGGAVFSPGSISWCGCLSYNNYDNNVSRITRNVLERFAGDGGGPTPSGRMRSRDQGRQRSARS